jgi:predicted amidohydrolase
VTTNYARLGQQARSTFGDVEANRNNLTRLIMQAARGGARVVVLPEAALTGYLGDNLRQRWQLPDLENPDPGVEGVTPHGVALSLDDPVLQRFARLAREWAIYLTVPFVEIDPVTSR